jgi:hypothetical protein
MAKAAERKLFTVTEPISGTVDGVPFNLNPDDVVEEGDPRLEGRQSLFIPYVPRVSLLSGTVEQATAAPGEKRGGNG